MTERNLTYGEKQRLCEALLKVRSLHDQDLRTLYLGELESSLGHPLNVQRYPDAHHDLYAIISACGSYPGALTTFIQIVHGFVGETTAILQVERLMAEIERQPDPADRDELARLLADVSPGRIAAVARDLFEAELPGSPVPWGDVRAVIGRIDEVPAPAGGLPPILVFADRLAHELESAQSIAIHRWIDAAAANVSEATLRQLCVDTRARLATVRAGAPASSIHDSETTTNSDNLRNTLDPTDTSPTPGVTVISQSLATRQPTATLSEQPETLRIWGGVPLRNPDFTGRESLLLQLQRALEEKSKASVLPQTLHGLGGVGKTQLAVEFVYRFAHRYQIVWWISAEQQSLVLQSLLELGRRLGVPETEDMKQAAGMVMDALASTPHRWLLIYDNADVPDDIAGLVPSAGGHVILTSRNQTWANVWDAIEVNVFERTESVELVRKRGEDISAIDADRLADKLGDLPLALDQAASWQAATGMPVSEYLELFDAHVQELLSEGKPTAYPTTVAAFVKLAFDRLSSEALAVAQLIALFAFLGAEPISVVLLRRGREARISEPLSRALRDPIFLNRTIRQLRRYGLAKVDADQRIQVHRLVQLVLREGLSDELAQQSRTNVHNLLASANPGEPDDPQTWKVHAEIGPHIMPADLINAESVDARRVVLDQIRYLWQVGDNEGSRRLGEAAVEAWTKAEGEPGLGPDGEDTLLATRHLSNALRSLGVNERAHQLNSETLDRFRRAFGDNHEHTLYTANGLGADLRLSGDFRAALDLDEDTYARHRQVYGDEDPATLRARSNLAVNQRMLSDFEGAYKVDGELARAWRETVGEDDPRTLFVLTNLARDLYGMGRYTEALELQRRTLPMFRVHLGSRHPRVLLAARTLAMALRKTGAYGEALTEARDNYRDCNARFGPDHEHSLAATMTFANTLRTVGELSEARSHADGAVGLYRRTFGESHPLSLAAAVNLAVILRALGELREARSLDQDTYDAMTGTLGAEHGYTLCAANNLANDLVLAHELDQARQLSEQTLAISRRSRGDQHPYTLACAVNAAFDLTATGDAAAGDELLDATAEALAEALGPDHPETVDAGRGKRAECDIEPPPT